MTPLNLETARELLHSKMQNQNLRRHCYAVSLVMRAYYDYYTSLDRDLEGLSADDWEIVGFLHDADYEFTKDDSAKHVATLISWLSEYEVKPEVLEALKTHNYQGAHLKEPQTLMEWTLECCDELTGFIVATALIMPNKKLSEVKVESVLKRFDQPAFARAVDRKQITQCEEKVSVPVKDFVKVSLKAMQDNSELLGL